MKLGKRIKPPEGETPKLGDKVIYEVIYDNGQKGTITTFVDEFDLEYPLESTKDETNRKQCRIYPSRRRS